MYFKPVNNETFAKRVLKELNRQYPQYRGKVTNSMIQKTLSFFMNNISESIHLGYAIFIPGFFFIFFHPSYYNSRKRVHKVKRRMKLKKWQREQLREKPGQICLETGK